MFEISVETQFNASHKIRLPDGSMESEHNHNWLVTAVLSSEKLNNIGIVMDFRMLRKFLKEIISQIENKSLNEIEYFEQNNPSAENVAKYFFEKLEPKLPKTVILSSISVIEEPGCRAKFQR